MGLGSLQFQLNMQAKRDSNSKTMQHTHTHTGRGQFSFFPPPTHTHSHTHRETGQLNLVGLPNPQTDPVERAQRFKFSSLNNILFWRPTGLTRGWEGGGKRDQRRAASRGRCRHTTMSSGSGRLSKCCCCPVERVGLVLVLVLVSVWSVLGCCNWWLSVLGRGRR